MGQPAIEAMALMRCECHTGRISSDSFMLDTEAGTVAVESIGTGAATLAAADIAAYGHTLLQAIDAAEHGGHGRLRLFATQCASGQFAHWEDARLALERSENHGIYWAIIVLIAALLAALWHLNS